LGIREQRRGNCLSSRDAQGVGRGIAADCLRTLLCGCRTGDERQRGHPDGCSHAFLEEFCFSLRGALL